MVGGKAKFTRQEYRNEIREGGWEIKFTRRKMNEIKIEMAGGK